MTSIVPLHALTLDAGGPLTVGALEDGSIDVGRRLGGDLPDHAAVVGRADDDRARARCA